MPPDGLRSRKPAIGEAAPSGSNSSILVLGSVTNTTLTPCADLDEASLRRGRLRGRVFRRRDGGSDPAQRRNPEEDRALDGLPAGRRRLRLYRRRLAASRRRQLREWHQAELRLPEVQSHD